MVLTPPPRRSSTSIASRRGIPLAMRSWTRTAQLLKKAPPRRSNRPRPSLRPDQPCSRWGPDLLEPIIGPQSSLRRPRGGVTHCVHKASRPERLSGPVQREGLPTRSVDLDPAMDRPAPSYVKFLATWPSKSTPPSSIRSTRDRLQRPVSLGPCALGNT